MLARLSRRLSGSVPHSFGVLSFRDYRHYWIAQSLSQIGSWMQVTAQAWLVFDLIPNPAEAAIKFGYINAVQFTPVLFLSLFAGVLLDAVPRRTVLLFTQSTMAFSAFTLVALTLTGTLSYSLLLGLTALGGVAKAFDMPARQSLVPDLVPLREVRNAVSLNSLSFNMARLIGPSVAAGAIALFGNIFHGPNALLRYGPAFGLDALSYLGVIAAIASIPLPPRQAKRHRVFREIREGLAYSFSHTELRLAILLAGSLSLTVINFNTIVPLFTKQALGLEVGGLGILLSSLGVGAIIAFAVNAYFPDDARLVLMRRGVLLLTLSFLAFTLTPNVLLAALALVLCGVGMILTTVNAQSTAQLISPDALRGRIMSVYMLVFAGATPFAALLISQLVARLGPRLGLLTVGLLGLAAALTLRPHRGYLKKLLREREQAELAALQAEAEAKEKPKAAAD